MAIDRLISLLAILLREEKATAARLAERLEVNQRTIYRDIERLCQAGIPLRSDRGRNGGVSIMEGYAMDRTLLTDADRGAILAELKDACVRRRVVRFTYCAPGGDSQRAVEPGKLVFRWSSWYLYGWCREREDWRLFKLNRMLRLEVSEESFAPRPAPDPVAPAEQVYPGTLEASIRFSPAARWRLIDEYGPESFTQEPDGSLLFRRGFPDREELFRWTLSFQDQAELTGPEDLRRELADRLRKIYGKYDR